MLYKLIGEDRSILEKSSLKTRQAFRISGIILIINILLCFSGFSYIYAVIFHSLLFAVLLSTFTTLIIYNIYKLCLVSIVVHNLQFSSGYIVSFLFRLLFIGGIGLFVAQGNMILLYDAFITAIDFESASILDLVRVTFDNNLLISITEPVIIISFLLPFLIKYFTKKNSLYSKSNGEITNQMIIDEYERFKIEYHNIFSSKYDLNIQIKNDYLDPPFNTKLQEIAEINIGTITDLRKLL